MIDEAEIKRGYEQEHGRPMSDGDYQALLKMMRVFECEDSESYQEAHTRILASLESMHDDPPELVAQRLSGFRHVD